MRTALYARVSTVDQKTLKAQVDEMRSYAEARGWDVVTEIKEVGSGAKLRPQRERLLDMARRREIDGVIVWKLDRWGRSTTDLLVSLDELIELGVGFVSLRDSLDLSTSMGRAMARMLATFAEFERDILRERVKAGVDAAREKGRVGGRPSTTASYVDRIYALHREGVPTAEIARRLKIPRTNVRRALEIR